MECSQFIITTTRTCNKVFLSNEAFPRTAPHSLPEILALSNIFDFGRVNFLSVLSLSLTNFSLIVPCLFHFFGPRCIPFMISLVSFSRSFLRVTETAHNHNQCNDQHNWDGCDHCQCILLCVKSWFWRFLYCRRCMCCWMHHCEHSRNRRVWGRTIQNQRPAVKSALGCGFFSKILNTKLPLPHRTLAPVK